MAGPGDDHNVSNESDNMIEYHFHVESNKLYK